MRSSTYARVIIAVARTSLMFGCTSQRCSTHSRTYPDFSKTRAEPMLSTSHTLRQCEIEGWRKVQLLNHAQLVVTRNWQAAFRDDALAGGAPIPDKNPPE